MAALNTHLHDPCLNPLLPTIPLIHESPKDTPHAFGPPPSGAGRPSNPSDVSHQWLVFRREGFSCPTRRERRADPQRSVRSEPRRGTRKEPRPFAVAPRMPRGFVVRPSQTAAGRLRPHALPRGILGATQHQPFVRHDTSGPRRPPSQRMPRPTRPDATFCLAGPNDFPSPMAHDVPIHRRRQCQETGSKKAFRLSWSSTHVARETSSGHARLKVCRRRRPTPNRTCLESDDHASDTSL